MPFIVPWGLGLGGSVEVSRYIFFPKNKLQFFNLSTLEKKRKTDFIKRFSTKSLLKDVAIRFMEFINLMRMIWLVILKP